MWVLDYLLCRPQFVMLGDKMSDIILTKTGAPQGTVLSPFLFSLYTSDYRHTQTSCWFTIMRMSTVMCCVKSSALWIR